MNEHPVRRALLRDLVPYLVSARRLRKQWFYSLHVLFGYTTDLVAAFAAIGVAIPLFTLLGTSGAAEQGAGAAPALPAALASLPKWTVLPASFIVVAWTVLRVAFNREEGQKRAVLAKSCTRALRHVEARLPSVLGTKDPIPAINEILDKTVRPSVDRGIQEDAWPWAPFAPKIDDEVARQVDALCTQYQQDWSPLPPTAAQQVS